MQVATPRVGNGRRDRREPFEHESPPASGAAGTPAGGQPWSPPPPRGSSPMIRGGVPPAAPEFPLTPTALAVPAWPVPSGEDGG